MKTKSSYKKKIREFMESRTYDIQEELYLNEIEVLSIINSDNKDWPRIAELAQKANMAVNEWALLNELIGLNKKKIAIALTEKDCPF